MTIKCAFLGLGVMGYPMTGHLVKKGFDVTVYNRTAAKAEAWVKEYGGKSAPSAFEAVRDADFVFACLGNDDDVRSVVLGDKGAFAGMKPGAVFADHTTDSADLARELEKECAARSLGFLDAPVSGGQAGAVNGALTIMVGGAKEVFDRAAPVMDAYACAVTHLGPAGCGQLAKMVNQIALAGAVQGLSEAVAFGMNAGLDMKRVIKVLEKGAAGSWQMSNRGETMVEDKFDFGFAVDWMRKDLGIALAEAKRNGSVLPVTALVDQFYGEVQAMGGSRSDTSSLICRLPRKKN